MVQLEKTNFLKTAVDMNAVGTPYVQNVAFDYRSLFSPLSYPIHSRSTLADFQSYCPR